MDRTKRIIWILLLLPSLAYGWTGSGGIWASKCGDFVATNFAGTQAGLDAAVAYCAYCGFVQIGPGLESLTPTTEAAGVTVVRADSSGWSVLRGSIYIGSAYPEWNGSTWPLLGAEKTFNLSSASSGEAAKTVDLMSLFPDSTAYTNLSLNGLHAINRYGASGRGGGDVNTGIAIGGYSEHRGSSAITGGLYGGEFASTMYNYGSVANLFGSLNIAGVTTGSVSSVTKAIGTQGLARVNGSGNGTIGTAIGVNGVAGFQDTGAGTISAAYGGEFGITKAGGATGTITSAYGVVVDNITQGSTNNYGVYINGASGGSSKNRALNVASGDVYLGGRVYPDSGIGCLTGGSIKLYDAAGTNIWTFAGNDGNFSISNAGYFSIGGFKTMSKSSSTIRMHMHTTNPAQGYAWRDSANAADVFAVHSDGSLVLKSIAFASLPASPTAGMVVFCSDCTRPSDPASGSGTGGMAIYANSRWYVP